MQDRSKNYASYEEWKGWDNCFVYNHIQASYYLGETKDCLIKGAKLLEIGFGSGGFMAWARKQGADVVGTEINERMLEAAKKSEYEVLPAHLSQCFSDCKNSFDTIVAFDVFEHLSLDEIKENLNYIEEMLRPGGKAMLRFPNGQSPFGLVTQHGDPTHISALSGSSFRYLVCSTKLKVVSYRSTYSVPISSFGIRSGGLTFIRRVVKKIIESLLNFAYTQNIPLSTNVVLVLEKEK